MNTESAYVEAVTLELENWKRNLLRKVNRDIVRDARGLPTWDQEMGWRIILRGTEGAKD